MTRMFCLKQDVNNYFIILISDTTKKVQPEDMEETTQITFVIDDI